MSEENDDIGHSVGRKQRTPIDFETLAMSLHEAGREAVEKGAVVNPGPNRLFIGWYDITEEAREGRRIQARFLLGRYTIIAK